MPSIVVDAGPLIALFDRRERHHRKAVKFIQGCSSRLVTNLPVLTEATLLLRFSVRAQRDMLMWAHQALIIDQDTSSDLPRIVALLEKYEDMPADFADVSLVAMAERLGALQVASLDRDFDRYRAFGKRPFINVFMAPE
jgi:predicted nucleic acid-binding protein